MDKNSEVLDKVTQLAKKYSLATSIGCRVMDAAGIEIYIDMITPTGCQFCTVMHQSTKNSFECLVIHQEAAEQAYLLQDSYIYSCPLNFIFWSSPVINEGQHVATVIAGSLLISSKDHYLKYDLSNQLKGFINKNALNALEKVNVLTEDRLSSLSELLILACRSYLKYNQRNFMNQHIKDSFMLKRMEEKQRWITGEERLLLEHLSRGDEPQALLRLKSITDAMNLADANNFYKVKNDILRISILLARTALENGATSDEVLSMNLYCLKEIHRRYSLADLHQWLSQLVKIFCDSVLKLNHLKHGEALARAIRFTQKKFSYNISLDDVAKEASLSPSYFSRIFKEEMKVSFSEYLNTLRVEESKRLLRSGELSLVEIASQCGFTDQSYFTKTFKKIVLVSPGKFRTNYRIAAKSYL